MTVRECINSNKFTISFEVFPPKAQTNFDTVKSATEAIAELGPSFISVTYGAGGGTSDYTLRIAKDITEKYGIPNIAHLTCVSSSKETVKNKIKAISDAGIKNIMALRGDIPKELSDCDRSNWDYNYATQLIEDLKSYDNDFFIGGACYPEIHPESKNQREDIIHLKEKVTAGCDFLTTQMFFDNNLFYNFLYKIREAGINVPILPGIMPIVKANQVERAIKLSGSFVPQRFKSIVDRFGSDASSMQQAGIAYATDQIIDLFANGITHVHIYTMNNPTVASKIMDNLSSILGKEL